MENNKEELWEQVLRQRGGGGGGGGVGGAGGSREEENWRWLDWASRLYRVPLPGGGHTLKPVGGARMTGIEGRDSLKSYLNAWGVTDIEYETLWAELLQKKRGLEGGGGLWKLN